MIRMLPGPDRNSLASCKSTWIFVKSSLHASCLSSAPKEVEHMAECMSRTSIVNQAILFIAYHPLTKRKHRYTRLGVFRLHTPSRPRHPPASLDCYQVSGTPAAAATAPSRTTSDATVRPASPFKVNLVGRRACVRRSSYKSKRNVRCRDLRWRAATTAPRDRERPN